MKAKDFKLKVVNEIENGKFEIEEFMPFMAYEDFVGCILGDAEILRPTGIYDIEGNMIYENYIIKVEDIDMLGNRRVYKCVINYNDSDAKFEAKEIRSDMKYIHQLSTLNCLCKLKIVGNIYQNNELLKSDC